MLKYSCLCFLVFVVSAGVFQYETWLNLPPVSIHQWRQADGEALAWHYAQGASFSAPEQFNLFKHGDSKAIGELPLLYWAAGKLTQCKVLDFPLRWIGLVWMFAGFWAFGWILLQYSKKPLIAALGAGLLMSSPILAYYGPNFLPDAPAFAMILWMGAALLRAEQRQSTGWLGVATLFAALAILLKISMVFLPGALLLAWAMGFRKHYWRASSLWGSWKPALASTLLLGLVLLGRWWIFQYNALHQTGYFFADIRPIWWYDGPAILEILKGIAGFGLPAYASLGLYLALFGSLLLVFRHFRALPFFWQQSIRLLALACFLFILIWFRMLREHDYYAICMMVFPAALLFLGLYLAMELYSTRRIIWALAVCWLLGLTYSHFLLERRLQEAFTPSSSRNLPPEAFLADDALTRAGIPETARFLCPEDPSPNIALLALKRKGWTAYNFGDRINADTLQNYAARFGLSHLALRDTSGYSNIYQAFFTVPVLHANGWYVYKH